MSKELYKVLTKDCRSPFQGFAYEVGKEYVCTDFDEDHSVGCSRGFYATDVDGLPYVYNIHQDVWRCEVGGKAVEIDQFKCRYEKFRLIKKIEPEELRPLALEWESRVGYKISEVLFPINPLLIQREKKVSEFEIDLLNKWSSVRASVEASVWASVWASVKAYIGSLFPNIQEWHYVKHKVSEYPFQSVVDLWKSGLVPSFDRKYWRLHAGENASVIYMIEIGR